MNFRQLCISRRSIAIAAALAGTVSLAIGAHAALNLRALDAAKAVATEQDADSPKRPARLALVIGNGNYPDANAPLTAPINAPDNALILTSAAPGKVAEDSKGEHSVLVSELLGNLAAQTNGAEAVFNKTRVSISRASDGEQVPSVSSSLLEDVRLGTNASAGG